MPNDSGSGYGKPPKDKQFKKGQSGNPKGRPKHTNNLKTDVTEELQETVVARVGDRTVKISKQRAIVKTVIAKTMKGDPRSANTFLNMFFRTIDPAGEIAETAAPMNAEEREVYEGFRARFSVAPKIKPDPDPSESNQVRFLLGPDRFLRIDPRVPAADISLDLPCQADDLISRAAHHSRIFMPQIEKIFCGHTAAPYQPLY